MTDASLVARMDANLMDYWGAYALAAGGRHETLPGALFMQTAIPHCLFNSVILTEPDLATIDRAISLSAELAGSGGVPVLWRVSPSAETAAVRARLEKAGLRRGEAHPAMLIELQERPEPPDIEGLRIVVASGPEERRDWGRLTIRSFEMEENLGAAMGDCEATIPAEMFDIQPRYTAYLNGHPVAVSSLVMSDGLAGVYAVATLPDARKRGIGTAMTLHAMAEGWRRGARSAILQATDMGRPVYERIGFRAVFGYQTYLQS